MSPEPDVLTRIALHTEKRLVRLKTQRPLEALRQQPHYARKPGDFASAFERPGLNVIAEVKFASPSEGFLRPDPTAEQAIEVAGSYLANGAAALSVLTERNFFAGAPEFLGAVRHAYPDAFLLMKDFMIDDYQFELARAEGADCILLIVALIGERLKDMLAQARALGLSALVEVHDEKEFDMAVAAGAAMIGVNNRNLRTLKTDLNIARGLARRAAPCLIAESGLESRRDLDELSGLGYRGFLIGSSLMKKPDPGAALKGLLS